MILKKYWPIFKQVAYFGIVGATTLAIDIGVSAALYYWCHLPAYLASGIGFCSGFFFNFPMNRKRVFHHSENDRFSFYIQLFLYIALSIFNLITTSIMVEIIVVQYIAEIQVAKLIVTIIIAIWNFLLFKFFIFSKRDNTTLREENTKMKKLQS